MNAAIQAVDVRKEAGQWFKALMLAGLILGLMMLASGAYLPVDSGRWLIEHNRRRIQDNYRPVRAPSNVTAQAAQPQTAGAGQQRQSPGVLGQQPTPPADNGMESIGVRQDRMSNEQATELLNGIMRPGNVIPDSE